VLFYISEHSLRSDHCNREINLALDVGKDVVPVYLKDVELTSDLKVGLNRVQALHRDQDSGYQQHLLNALGQSTTTVEPQPSPRELDPKSIAVLLFANLSPDPDNAYFAAGIHEEILNHLAGIGALSVISRTAMLRYEGSKKSPSEVAAELNVATVLEGSVRYAGNRVRITAQLIRASDDVHLWSQTYDRDLEDIFAIQSDVAVRIAAAMEAQLSPEQRARIERRPTGNMEAYSLFLAGIAALQHDDNEPAIALFENATGLDPEFSAAWALIALACVPVSGRMDDARRAASRALELDTDSFLAHRAMGLVFWIADLNPSQTLIEYARALELNPSSGDVNKGYGLLLANFGRHDEGLKYLRKAATLESNQVEVHRQLMWVLFTMGHFEEAAHEADLMRQLDTRRSRWPGDWLDRFLSYRTAGRQEAADEQLSEAQANLAHLPETFGRPRRAAIHAIRGDQDAALAALDALQSERILEPLNIAFAWIELGDTNAALDVIDELLERRDFGLLAFLPVIPALAALHDHPRFDAIRRKLGYIQ
jgi:TolB-like protein